MISFKNYIKEDLLKYADEAGQRSMSRLTYNQKRFASPVFLIWSSLIEDDYMAIPLYGSIIERIEKKMSDKAPKRRNVVGLHATKIDNYDGLKKLERGRKPISASTQIADDHWRIFLESGVDQGAGAVYMIRGDLAARFSGDSFTELDKNGKRWADFYQMIRKEDKKYIPMHKILQRIRAKTKAFLGNLLDIDQDMFRSYFLKSDKEKKEDTQIEEILRSTTNEEKSEIVKFYYDLCSEEMAENAELFSSAFFRPTEELTDAYDEALFFNFKIEKVFVSIAVVTDYARASDPVGMKKIADYAKRFERDGVECVLVDDKQYKDLPPTISWREYREAIKEYLI